MWTWLAELLDIRRVNYEVRLRLKEEHEERMSVCRTCEVLKVELSNMRRERDVLFQRVLNPVGLTPNSIPDDTAKEPLPLIQRHKPWRVKQQELEQQDKAEAARIMAEFKERTKKVEETIGVK